MFFWIAFFVILPLALLLAAFDQCEFCRAWTWRSCNQIIEDDMPVCKSCDEKVHEKLAYDQWTGSWYQPSDAYAYEAPWGHPHDPANPGFKDINLYDEC